MPDNPPPLYLTATESRELFFHHYQIFDVVRGSGTVARDSGVGLYIDSCAGAGPLYDIWLVDDYPHADSGIDEIQVGDFLLVADDTDDSHTVHNYAWYRYDIQEILTTPNANSGEFRVRYVTDTHNQADADPCLHHFKYQAAEYGYSAPSEDCNTVVRRVNVDFLLGD